MNKEALDLFISNYENQGMCKNLPKFIKAFVKTFKKENKEKIITYYPWAVVEKLFRMQGGSIDVVDWAKNIEFKSVDYAPNDQGELVLQDQTNTALFIHLVGKWQGETLDEFYPLFDNQTAKVIKTPNAMDLNTARQRGSVRLIARLSGIGLDVFEQQDTQFDDDDVTPESAGEKTTIKKKEDVKEEPKVSKEEVKKSKKQVDKEKTEKALEEVVKETTSSTPDTPKEKITNHQTQEPTYVPKPETTPIPEGSFMEKFLKGEEIVEETPAPSQVKVQETFVKETYGKDTEEHANLLLEVRKLIREGNLQTEAKAFVKSKKRELLSELTYDELQELRSTIK